MGSVALTLVDDSDQPCGTDAKDSWTTAAKAGVRRDNNTAGDNMMSSAIEMNCEREDQDVDQILESYISIF